MKNQVKKHKIALVRLGHTHHLVDFQKIMDWKSELFSISGIYKIEHLPESDVNDGYWDVKYSKARLGELVSCPDDSDYAIAIMPYRFEDNFYMHRINNKCAVISLYGIPDILQSENISVEHFIINQLYVTCAIKHVLNDISSGKAYTLKHRDTRGCLFDMNGERTDILYNTEHPIICDECKGKFKSTQIKEEVISIFERELKKIEKPWVLRLEKWIKKYPLFSILISGVIYISLSIIANLIWECIKR